MTARTAALSLSLVALCACTNVFDRGRLDGAAAPDGSVDGGTGCTGCAADRCFYGRCCTSCSDAPVTALAVARQHTCAVKAGNVYCFGDNHGLQLGVGAAITESLTPMLLPGSPVPAWIAAGYEQTSVIAADGTSWSVGLNSGGELGDGSDTAVPTIRQSSTAADPSFRSISIGEFHACALREPTADLWCWGANDDGQVGVGLAGASTRHYSPERIFGESDYRVVCAGDSHTCGVKNDGTMKCWGANASGQLGIGSTDLQRSPTVVPGTWETCAAGPATTCAIDTSGHLACWGDATLGQVGDGSPGGMRTSPVTIDTTHRWSRVVVAHDHACAIDDAGVLQCWGDNSSGQLGVDSSTLTMSDVPVDVVHGAASGTWVDVGVGAVHTCAVAVDGRLFCWGRSSTGQLGQPGLTSPVLHPVETLLP